MREIARSPDALGYLQRGIGGFTGRGVMRTGWSSPGSIGRWLSGADLSKYGNKTRGIGIGMRAGAVGAGMAAADFLNPFSFGWND